MIASLTHYRVILRCPIASGSWDPFVLKKALTGYDFLAFSATCRFMVLFIHPINLYCTLIVPNTLIVFQGYAILYNSLLLWFWDIAFSIVLVLLRHKCSLFFQYLPLKSRCSLGFVLSSFHSCSTPSLGNIPKPIWLLKSTFYLCLLFWIPYTTSSCSTKVIVVTLLIPSLWSEPHILSSK